jgi:hypothetical protein
MKVELNKELTQITITGNFDVEGVPTKAAESDSTNDGRNHGSTGFPVATSCQYKDKDGNMRVVYVGVNVTSHLAKGSKTKPKL